MQSPAQQDMDRKLQALAAEHDAHMQALMEEIEARRLLILKGESDPAVTPDKSVGSSSTGNWEKVNEPRAPEAGSSSAEQGDYPAGPPESFGKQTPPPSNPKAPTSPSKASGIVVPDQPHSLEQRRADQQAEEAALNEAAQARALQETIDARVAAAVEEALRKRDFE